MQFKYDENATLDLTKATLQALHPDSNLFFDDKEDPNIPRFELRIPSFNKILSNHYWGPMSGFALGKLYNLFGPESIGKSAFGLHVISDILAAGGRGSWDDAERSWDENYTKSAYNLSKFNPNFALIEPDYGEEAFDAAQVYAESGATSVVVIDSVSALGTKRTQENAAEKNDVASLALKLSQHLQRIIGTAADNKCSIIYINQLRENLISMGGVMTAAGKKFTGGNAMKFYPHVALEFKKVKDVWNADKTEYIGKEVSIECIKNKISRPFIKASFMLIPGEGFSRGYDILSLAAAVGTVETKGSYIYFKGQSVGNGLRQQLNKMKEHPELIDDIWEVTKPLLEPQLNTETQTENLQEALPVETPNSNTEVPADKTSTKKTRKKAA